jgi:nitrite reductase (NADH) small subunit
MLFEIETAADLPSGRARACVVNGQTIALYHTRDGYFATGNACPHRGGPLAEGDLLGNEIVCPWHFWSFDVATGVCLGNPEVSLDTHEIRVEGERIFVRLS